MPNTTVTIDIDCDWSVLILSTVASTRTLSYQFPRRFICLSVHAKSAAKSCQVILVLLDFSSLSGCAGRVPGAGAPGYLPSTAVTGSGIRQEIRPLDG